MNKIRIKSMLAINGYILMVYYSPKGAYQFSIIDEKGEVIDFSEIFYTFEAAKGKGKSVIRTFQQNLG